jgi:hypothetical protein
MENSNLQPLYDIPRYSRIRIEKEELNFFYIDGMYSYCENDRGKTVNIAADTMVEFVCSMKEHDLKRLY